MCQKAARRPQVISRKEANVHASLSGETSEKGRVAEYLQWLQTQQVRDEHLCTPYTAPEPKYIVID